VNMGEEFYAHEQELLRRDIEEAFDRMLSGTATDEEKSLVAWQLGIGDHWKRISQRSRA